MYLILDHVHNDGGFQIQVYQPISVSMWQWKSETISHYYCSTDMKSTIIPRELLNCCLDFGYDPVSLHFPICKVRCYPWQALRPLPSPTLVFTLLAPTCARRGSPALRISFPHVAVITTWQNPNSSCSHLHLCWCRHGQKSISVKVPRSI